MEQLSLCSNLAVGENGHLFFAGQDAAVLARQYGTPLYLMDEDRVPRPPVVMLRGGESYTAVRSETAEDLLSLDV